MTTKAKARPVTEEEYRSDGEKLYWVLVVGEKKVMLEDAATEEITEVTIKQAEKMEPVKRG